jgi:hypothetical protein
MRQIARVALAGLVTLGLAVTAVGQPKPEGGKPYLPSLADMMILVQIRHAKLWLAGQAANWELANFAIHELEEGLEDIARHHPVYKDSPIAPLIEGSVKMPVEEVERAINARNRAAFTGGYDRLTAACNACHQATNHGFIVIQRPAGSPFANQSFAPAR